MYLNASIETFRGNHRRAQARIDELIDDFRGVDDAFGVMLSRELLAVIAFERGDDERAESILQDLIEHACRTDYFGEITYRERLGRLYARSGRSDEAIEQLDAVRQAADDRGFNILVWYFFGAEAEAFAHQNRRDDVERVFREALRTDARPGLHAETIAAGWRRTARLVRSERPKLADEIEREAEAILDEPMKTPVNRRGPSQVP